MSIAAVSYSRYSNTPVFNFQIADSDAISRYVSAYNLINTRIPTDLTAQDYRQAGDTLRAVEPTDFNPDEFDLPLLSSAQLRAIAEGHQEAALLILRNPHYAQLLTDEDLHAVGSTSLRASWLMLLSRGR